MEDIAGLNGVRQPVRAKAALCAWFANMGQCVWSAGAYARLPIPRVAVGDLRLTAAMNSGADLAWRAFSRPVMVLAKLALVYGSS
jgi:hypothetical protein